ncbi:MAG: glycosyltransferase family 4 protein [Rhodocyclaceae bacterium]
MKPCRLCVRKLRTAWRVLRVQGPGTFLRLTQQRLAASRHIDVCRHYRFVSMPAIGQPCKQPPPPRSVNWVIPMYAPGSGGHINIFRFVDLLERRGFDCRIVIVPGQGTPPPSARQAAKEIAAWFQPLRAPIFCDIAKAPPARVTLATSWPTAYYARAFQPTWQRGYFVQDFEPWFYPPGSEYAFAEATYRFGFFGITAGRWLEAKLASEYGMPTEAVGFSYDHALYSPQPRKNPRQRQIFFYARPPTPRRGFELGLLALAEVVRRMPDVRVVFAGWDVSAYRIPFDHNNAGVLPVKHLAELYSQCDVALVLSFSNLSLLPLELMACGTPVVSNRGPWVEWLLDDTVAELADATPTGLADALCRVLEDEARRRWLRENGLALARATSWEAEGDKLAQILTRLGA